MGIRRLLSQWTTKTLGGSTKLSVDDYHLIQDPVHIEDGNIDAIYLTNAVGRATNTQGYGPIPGTGKIVRQSGFDASEITFFKPAAGQVYLLTGAAATSIGGGTSIYLFLSSGSTTSHVLIDRTTSANAPMTLNEPIYLDDTVYLTVRTESAPSGTPALNASFIRVR